MVVRNAKPNANKYDIVYFVKESAKNEELRYSLRSLVNFPYNRVWFYGYRPHFLKPDKYVNVSQQEENKWKNVGKMLKMVVENSHITDNFWLFNDDFFIMEKTKEPPIYHNGDLYKRVVTLEDYYKRFTPYSRWLRECCKELENIGTTTKNFETHTPILINRLMAQELHNICGKYAFRSLYGNYCDLDSIDHRDVKIITNDAKYISGVYLSTDDVSFRDGVVGEQIRARFKDKCKYEI